MVCFSGLLGMLIWIIVVIAVVAIIRVVLSYFPVPAIAIQIANIILWAVCAIAVIYVVFDLLGCAFPVGHFR